jgi:hypothetical protein
MGGGQAQLATSRPPPNNLIIEAAMKSFLRIVLPILVVAGLAFGITFLKLYSPDEASTDDPSLAGKGSSRVLPLNFYTLLAAVPKEDTNERGEKEIPNSKRHLKYWDPDLEVGAPGHYAFWCQNRNDKPVVVRVPRVSCQCAGADLAIVPADAYRDYLIGSALAGGPLCSAFIPTAALTHVALSRRLDWNVLINPDQKQTLDGTVPPADPTTGPQFALVRLTWTGKAVGPKTIDAQLFAGIGDGIPSHTELKAAINVVPAFDVVRRDESGKWSPVRELPFGELVAESAVHQEFFISSTTRAHLLLNIASEPSDTCVTWTEPVPASANELTTLQDLTRGEDKSIRRVKSLYKVRVTVRERVVTNDGGKKEIHTLDLGLLERKLTVSAVDGGTMTLAIKGRVLGEVTLLGGADSGRIDLGSSFPADIDRTRDVVLLAERPGLELSLLETDIVPNYLKVKLEPLPPLGERNQYRLRVTVPKHSVIGALPENSAVVLKTNGPNPRRLRVPVKGTTFDSGGPRL